LSAGLLEQENAGEREDARNQRVLELGSASIFARHRLSNKQSLA
jgi:hypothetical protein